MRPVAVVVALVFSLYVSGAARAASPMFVPDTAVRLKDGSLFQGVLVEQAPGDHITIQLADGTVRKFAAADVTQVRNLHEHEHEQEHERAPAAGPPAAYAPPTQGRPITVDIVSTHPDARLWQLSLAADHPGRAPTFTNVEVCGVPCGRSFPAGSYMISGQKIQSSVSFDLEPATPHVRVVTDPVTTDRRHAATFFAGGAAGLGGLGGTFLLYGFFFRPTSNSVDTAGLSTLDNRLNQAGLALLGLGLVSGVIAAVLYFKDTAVRVETVEP
jgi:hypothetical protein